MSIEKFTGGNKTPLPNDQSVLDFLRQSPDFFLRHPSALSELSLPHESGKAGVVSRTTDRYFARAQYDHAQTHE
jgi:uncharacterized protein YigA (DUF484 family)